jgi:hypothetical protein
MLTRALDVETRRMTPRNAAMNRRSHTDLADAALVARSR